MAFSLALLFYTSFPPTTSTSFHVHTHCAVCGILFPRAGIEPVVCALMVIRVLINELKEEDPCFAFVSEVNHH